MSSSATILGSIQGEMAKRIRDHDWSGTPLGPESGWPQSLRLALAVCLHSRFPMFIWWGPELVTLYNDDYIPILGARHPHALGGSAPEIWPEVWDLVAPQVDAVMERGESTWNDRVRMLVNRDGAPAEAYFTWSYAPIPDDAGGVGGLLCTILEETERVRAEQSLSETRRRLDSALIAGEVGTFEWDVEADRIWGDANFERLFGVGLDETGAAPLTDYLGAIHPEDRERVAARVERAVATGSDYEAEYRIIHGSRTRWVVARGRVERDESGRAIRFPGVVLDVTDRKAAENALRASEARYRALFDSVDEGFCIIEVLFDGDQAVDYRFLEGNPAWEKHTGLVGALGKTAREVLPDLEEHWFEIYGQVARTGEPVRFESGSDVMGRWFDVFAFPVEELGSGKVALLFNDITDQRRTAEALSQSRERFRAVLENAVDVAYRRDLRTDTYDYLSPRVEHVLGIEVDRMRAMTVDAILDRMHPEDRARVARIMEEETAQGGGRVEYRWRTDDGEYRWLADHFTVQTDDDGAPLFRTGTVRDVSDRKETEAALEEAKDQAEQASQAKSQFLAVMSHELRTPLTGIIGFADLMETEVLGPTTARQQESLARVKASAWHLIGIIDEILTLSRAEAGSEGIHSREADIAEIIRDVVRIAEPEASSRGLVIETMDADQPFELRTDPGKVRRVLINLVGNAVKYGGDGRITVQLDRSDADLIRVHVRDTGPGIADTEQERIFEPFTQLDSSHTRTAAGAGLGLAICRRLARLLGGDVTVESAPGEGSTFSLTVPKDGGASP
jgi:PAS domain S-box-containing protein